MEQAGENDGAGVWGFTGWWFSLVFMCATQDIAVDGIFPAPYSHPCIHTLLTLWYDNQAGP